MYVVIAGGGKVGEYLAMTTIKKGHEVAIIELNARVAHQLAQTLPDSALVISGDGCDSRFQEDADIENADVFVATMGQDDANLVSCDIAKVVFKVPRAIARVNNPKNLRIFEKSDIEAVSTTTVISRIIEEETFEGNLRMARRLAKSDVVMLELELPGDDDDFLSDEGRALGDIRLPQACLLVAVQRDNMMQPVTSETMLYPEDSVIVLARSGAENSVRRALHVSI